MRPAESIRAGNRPRRPPEQLPGDERMLEQAMNANRRTYRGEDTASRLLEPGGNCWRIEEATRAAVLIDAASYFKAFTAAVKKAGRSVYIVGWDIHSRLRLLREDSERGERPEGPVELREFLNEAVSRNRDLQVNLLIWDFAMVFLLEREIFPVFQLDWKTERRVRFHLDANHPIGASRHQKIVVIDDRLAFVGGLDLTQQRWDTRRHLPEDPRRRSPGGTEYGPYHDVQVLVEGPVAAALGELVRTRWRRATGKELPPPEVRSDPWPEGLEADVNGGEFGIARTEAAYRDQPEVREVEKLHLDSIAAARQSIYMENQYLTSHRIAGALARRLEEKDGPEVVLISSRVSGGWLEQASMGLRRLKFLDTIRSADRHGRLRVLYPLAREGSRSEPMKVHAKVTVIDDRLLRIGSANLTNRSMGLDSECDLALEAGSRETADSIRRVRDRLLGHQLGESGEAVRRALGETGSLAALVDELGPRSGRLEPLESEYEPLAGSILPEHALFDPEEPIRAESLLEFFGDPREGKEQGKGRPLAGIVTAVIVLLAVAALWRFTDLGQRTDPALLSAWFEPVRQSAAAPLAVVAGFVVGGLILLPVTALIAATALGFGPWYGFLYALIGTLASAVTTYGIGKWLWRDALRRLVGDRLNRLASDLDRQGVLVIAAVRLVPVAPFSIVNLVAGSSGIRFRNYFLGTVIGMAPGMFVLALFADRAAQAVREPSMVSVLTALGMLLVLFAVSWFARRLAKRKVASREAGRGEERGEGA